MTQLCLIENVIPDNIGNVVSDGFDRFFDVPPILLDLRPDKFHDCIASLLACLQKQTWRHFIDQAAECLDLAFVMLSLNGEDSLL